MHQPPPPTKAPVTTRPAPQSPRTPTPTGTSTPDRSVVLPTVNPAIQEDSVLELLTGLKHLAASLPETVGTIKATMLDTITYAVTKAKAEAKAKATNMENDLRVIKALLATQGGLASMSTDRPVSAPPTTTEQKETMTYAAKAAKMQQMDVIKQLREKTEVNIYLAETEQQNTLGGQLLSPNLDEKNRTQLLEEFINNEITRPSTPGKKPGHPIRVAGTTRVSKSMLKIICTTPEDAEAIRSLRWKEMLGVTIAKPTFGVVVHGVPKTAFNPRQKNFNAEAAIKELEKRNPTVKVLRVTPLLRKPKNPNASTQSVVIITEDRNHADHLIVHGTKVDDSERGLTTQRHMPQHQLTQCYKCQGYRHRSSRCTREQRCGKCAGDHSTTECRVTDPHQHKCAMCGGNHTAWSDSCPRRAEEVKKLECLRDATPATFIPQAPPTLIPSP
jgi:hypothetical protein